MGLQMMTLLGLLLVNILVQLALSTRALLNMRMMRMETGFLFQQITGVDEDELSDLSSLKYNEIPSSSIHVFREISEENCTLDTYKCHYGNQSELLGSTLDEELGVNVSFSLSSKPLGDVTLNVTLVGAYDTQSASV